MATRRSRRPSTSWASTTHRAPSPNVTIDLEDLGLDAGGHLLLKHELASLAPGARLEVRGTSPDLPLQLRAWCRQQGHTFVEPGTVVRGSAIDARWTGAERAGQRDE